MLMLEQDQCVVEEIPSLKSDILSFKTPMQLLLAQQLH